MFDIGWSEILVIAIVIVVVVGPKDLPRMLRAFGRATSKFRAQAGEFRRQFDEALKEAELDGVHDLIRDARSLDPRSGLRDALNPLLSAGEDIKTSLRDAESSIAANATALNGETLPAPAPETHPAPIGSLSVPGFASTSAEAAGTSGEARKTPARKSTPRPKRTESAPASPVGEVTPSALPAKRTGKTHSAMNGKASGVGPAKAAKTAASGDSPARKTPAATGSPSPAPVRTAAKPAAKAGATVSAKPAAPARANRTAAAKPARDKGSDT